MRTALGLLQILLAIAVLAAGPVVIDVWIGPNLPDSMFKVQPEEHYRGFRIREASRNLTTEAAWALNCTWIISTIALMSLGVATLLGGPDVVACDEDDEESQS